MATTSNLYNKIFTLNYLVLSKEDTILMDDNY